MTIFINELNLIHSFNIFSRLSVNYNYYYYIIIIIMIMIIITIIINIIIIPRSLCKNGECWLQLL